MPQSPNHNKKRKNRAQDVANTPITPETVSNPTRTKKQKTDTPYPTFSASSSANLANTFPAPEISPESRKVWLATAEVKHLGFIKNIGAFIANNDLSQKEHQETLGCRFDLLAEQIKEYIEKKYKFGKEKAALTYVSKITEALKKYIFSENNWHALDVLIGKTCAHYALLRIEITPQIMLNQFLIELIDTESLSLKDMATLQSFLNYYKTKITLTDYFLSDCLVKASLSTPHLTPVIIKIIDIMCEKMLARATSRLSTRRTILPLPDAYNDANHAFNRIDTPQTYTFTRIKKGKSNTKKNPKPTAGSVSLYSNGDYIVTRHPHTPYASPRKVEGNFLIGDFSDATLNLTHVNQAQLDDPNYTSLLLKITRQRGHTVSDQGLVYLFYYEVINKLVNFLMQSQQNDGSAIILKIVEDAQSRVPGSYKNDNMFFQYDDFIYANPYAHDLLNTLAKNVTNDHAKKNLIDTLYGMLITNPSSCIIFIAEAVWEVYYDILTEQQKAICSPLSLKDDHLEDFYTFNANHHNTLHILINHYKTNITHPQHDTSLTGLTVATTLLSHLSVETFSDKEFAELKSEKIIDLICFIIRTAQIQENHLSEDQAAAVLTAIDKCIKICQRTLPSEGFDNSLSAIYTRCFYQAERLYIDRLEEKKHTVIAYQLSMMKLLNESGNVTAVEIDTFIKLAIPTYLNYGTLLELHHFIDTLCYLTVIKFEKNAQNGTHNSPLMHLVILYYKTINTKSKHSSESNQESIEKISKTLIHLLLSNLPTAVKEYLYTKMITKKEYAALCKALESNPTIKQALNETRFALHEHASSRSLHQNRQNTHTASIHAGVNEAIAKLTKAYPVEDNGIPAEECTLQLFFKERAKRAIIDIYTTIMRPRFIPEANSADTIDFVKTLFLNNAALICAIKATGPNSSLYINMYKHCPALFANKEFSALKLVNYLHAYKEIKDAQLAIKTLHLVWRAIHDPHYAHLRQDNIATLQTNLAQLLIEVTHDADNNPYPAPRPACFSGIINKLVSTLEPFHPLVKLSMMTSDTIIHYIRDFYDDKFKLSSEADKLKIYTDSDFQENVHVPHFFLSQYSDAFITHFKEDIRLGGIRIETVHAWLNCPAPAKTYCPALIEFAQQKNATRDQPTTLASPRGLSLFSQRPDVNFAAAPTARNNTAAAHQP